MYKLNLDLTNRDLYRGCEITEFEPKRFRLVTPDDSATVIVAANLIEILKMIPESNRDELVLTGTGPEIIRMTVQSILQPAFKKLTRHDGRKKTTIEIPQPPDDHDGEPE